MPSAIFLVVAVQRHKKSFDLRILTGSEAKKIRDLISSYTVFDADAFFVRASGKISCS